MGYDMYVVGEDGQRVFPGGMTREDFYDQDIDTRMEFYDSDYYLRRNIFNGRVLAQGLVDAGMGYWPTGEVEDFPDSPKPYEAHYDEDHRPVTEEASQYAKLMEQHLRKTYDERPGISVYKLCSTNDGFWVTKAEVTSALWLWEQAGEPVHSEDWDYGDVMPFLRRAAQHGGFRVY